jgi:hypothetical protein
MAGRRSRSLVRISMRKKAMLVSIAGLAALAGTAIGQTRV